MALSHIIAHRVHRASPTATTQIDAREHCWHIDGRVEECFRELKQCVLKRTGKDYGRFSDDRALYPVASWLEETIEQKMSFESFSEKAMQHFKIELDKTEAPLDAYFVFAHEELEAATLIHIFMVQHNSGQYIDGELLISDSLYLDTSGVRLAAKINITDWKGEDPYKVGNSLAFLRWRGEKDLTDAFENFIGFTERVDLSAETEEFLNVVTDYTKDLPDDVAEHTRAQVVDYCLEQDKRGEPVVIDALSTELKENAPQEEDAVKPPEFSKYIAERNPKAKPELIPDKSQLKQFVRISGRNEMLSMSFASSCLGESIIYDADDDSLTIKNLPPSLKSRLLKHFNER